MARRGHQLQRPSRFRDNDLLRTESFFPVLPHVLRAAARPGTVQSFTGYGPTGVNSSPAELGKTCRALPNFQAVGPSHPRTPGGPPAADGETPRGQSVLSHRNQ
jgi:hypothetical protein